MECRENCGCAPPCRGLQALNVGIASLPVHPSTAFAAAHAGEVEAQIQGQFPKERRRRRAECWFGRRALAPLASAGALRAGQQLSALGAASALAVLGASVRPTSPNERML